MTDTRKPDPDLSEPLKPGLYIVATPIGNLGDITLRAVDMLSRCGRIACEDTRVTGKLLKHLGISKPLIRFDDHASEQASSKLLEMMAGEAIVLVSDAGTPLISDPGYRLVREARDRGISVTSLPGPCAAIVGMTLSGLPSDRFLFAGFLPPKDKARRDMLEELERVPASLIFYETGPRLTKSLAVLAEIWPDREVAVARELTKLYEECRTGSAADLLEHYEAEPPKGEIVLLVGPPGTSGEEIDPDELLREALADHKPSQAAALVAKATGLDRKELYARAMELKRG
ncbi:rRNA small subunit methyltransferase I [Altererythrobacter epoxidivorans]|uniref:Ribosomal RNA small subunit methyltransferase I n=1 Tax=Altererythrobacter epoxidivorans TaxID=361183 RepID=A0A0M4M7H6_9SPHN|nr:16S rRNA (cytidine(1402)-2'-O)-methyltransferase [Altererythrobacter epoxidivorans]ALE16439.1 rRNA small subunit methyltransferase I [Altererythrobacter epoxidivorans]